MLDKPILGRELYEKMIKPMQEKGLLPPQIRRVIIDIPYDNIVTLYVECCADKQMFEIDMTNLLKDANVVTMKEKQNE